MTAAPDPVGPELQSYPMDPTEALALGRLMERRQVIDDRIEDVLNRARRRIGLAADAPLAVDFQGARYVEVQP